MNNLTSIVDQLQFNFINWARDLRKLFTNLTSLVDKLQLNYNNLTKDLQSKFEINNYAYQIGLNNKNLTEEIQIISNTSKLHSKFQAEIYQAILQNKLNFQNFV